jgi:hypothetical protein
VIKSFEIIQLTVAHLMSFIYFPATLQDLASISLPLSLLYCIYDLHMYDSWSYCQYEAVLSVGLVMLAYSLYLRKYGPTGKYSVGSDLIGLNSARPCMELLKGKVSRDRDGLYVVDS